MSKIVGILVRLRGRLGYRLYVLIAILAYTIAFSIVEIALYESFRIYTWDLGIFNQSLWNTLHGRFLYYTTETGIYTTTGSLLATHFMPIVLLALPVYALFPTGETLLVTSTFIVALGAMPIYGIAKSFLKNEKIAAILGISYLFYPPLQGLTLSGFSAETFAATIFLFVVYYLLKPDTKRLALAVGLGLLTHEASVPIVAFIGLYGIIYHRSIKSKGLKASLAIIVVSIPFFFFAQNMRILFGWNQSPSLWNEWALMGARGPSDIPLSIMLNPVGALSSLTFDGYAKLVYLMFLLLPLLFLPLLGLRGIIPSTPYLFVSLLSSYPIYYSQEGHYAAFVAPFFFLGFLHTLMRWQDRFRLKVSISILTKSVVSASIISLLILLPLAYSQYQPFNVNREHIEIVRSYLLQIPQNASILTQNDIFPHVSDRPDAYTIASPGWGANYELADKEILQNLSRLDLKYVLLDFASSDRYAARAANLIYTDFILPNWNRYDLIAARNGVVLFRLNL